MTSGPAILQLVQTFEFSARDQTQKSPHHDDTPSAQKKFLEDVKEMTKTIEDFGNPFLEESKELVSLDSNMVSDKTNLYEFETKGETQFEEFRNKVNTEQFYSPITKNNYEIFKNCSKLKKKNTSQNKVKQDCVLFSNLFIMCQTRQLNLDDFFVMRTNHHPQPLALMVNFTVVLSQT